MDIKSKPKPRPHIPRRSQRPVIPRSRPVYPESFSGPCRGAPRRWEGRVYPESFSGPCRGAPRRWEGRVYPESFSGLSQRVPPILPRRLSSLKARFVNTSRWLFFGSFPVISSPSLGHEFVREVCRIHTASRRMGRLMTTPRLHLPGSSRLLLALDTVCSDSTRDRWLPPDAVPPLQWPWRGPCAASTADITH